MTTIKKDTYTQLKEIKKDLMKVARWEEDVTIMVKVYDCDESGEQTYDVEINYGLDGDVYTDGFVNDTFYGVIEDDSINAEAEKQAVKRAKAVLKTVKGWFEMYDNVKVENEVEVYHQ